MLNIFSGAAERAVLLHSTKGHNFTPTRNSGKTQKMLFSRNSYSGTLHCTVYPRTDMFTCSRWLYNSLFWGKDTVHHPSQGAHRLAANTRRSRKHLWFLSRCPSNAGKSEMTQFRALTSCFRAKMNAGRMTGSHQVGVKILCPQRSCFITNKNQN